MASEPDETAESLLVLHGEVFAMDNGYWTKFEVYRVEPSEHNPHGVRYSLTLHDRRNTRVLGFDNAHGYTPKKKRYGARNVTWDHTHRGRKVTPYEYESAVQLLEDFWREVERIVAEEKE